MYLNEHLDAILGREQATLDPVIPVVRRRDWALGLTEGGGQPAAIEASQEDVAPMLEALTRVCRLHMAVKQPSNAAEVCQADGELYPCPTVAAIVSALER